MTPRAERFRRKLLPRVDVSHLHVIDAGSDAGLVDAPDHGVAELAVVHQAAVPDRAIQDPNLLAVGHPLGHRLVLRLSAHPFSALPV